MKKLRLPFGWSLYVSICDRDELDKETKKLRLNFNFNDNEKIHGIAEFIFKKTPKPSFFIVWVDKKKNDHLYFLLHEIHHIVALYCEHLEISDEEFSAYLFEDICRQLKLMEMLK